LYKEVH